MNLIALKFLAAGFIAVGLMFLSMAIGAGWTFIRNPRAAVSAHPTRGRTMTKDEQEIETEIQAKGLNAPRLTPAHIDAQIVGEQFYVFPGTTMTVCALTLRNGFVVVGESAAASPENFDAAIGKRIARDNARGRIWALEGYNLRTQLAA